MLGGEVEPLAVKACFECYCASWPRKSMLGPMKLRRGKPPSRISQLLLCFVEWEDVDNLVATEMKKVWEHYAAGSHKKRPAR
jgi:hypothetical protein